MKTYFSWKQRKGVPLPETVIIDTDECSITEFAQAAGSPIRQGIQKVVPGMAWLKQLYTAMEHLRLMQEKAYLKIDEIYDQAVWLDGKD